MLAISVEQWDDELRFEDYGANYKINLTDGKFYYYPYDTKYARIPYSTSIKFNKFINLIILNILDGASKIFALQKSMLKIIHFNLCELFCHPQTVHK